MNEYSTNSIKVGSGRSRSGHTYQIFLDKTTLRGDQTGGHCGAVFRGPLRADPGLGAAHTFFNSCNKSLMRALFFLFYT